MKEILRAVVAIAVGVLLMAAPYYAEASLKAYAAYFFWGGLGVTVVALIAVVIVAVKRSKASQKADTPVAESRTKRPTLEATRSSTIDATGATIPGDLPFQFGKADDHSVIAMSGVTVTRKDDGTILVASGNGNRQFPPPDGQFSMLSNEDLKLQAQRLGSDLRGLQRRLSEDTKKLMRNENGQISRAEFKAYHDPYASEYRTRFAPTALSLASEFLNRLNSVTPTTQSAKNGATMILYKAFAGPTPASDAADFLDYLGQQLSDG